MRVLTDAVLQLGNVVGGDKGGLPQCQKDLKDAISKACNSPKSCMSQQKQLTIDPIETFSKMPPDMQKTVCAKAGFVRK